MCSNVASRRGRLEASRIDRSAAPAMLAHKGRKENDPEGTCACSPLLRWASRSPPLRPRKIAPRSARSMSALRSPRRNVVHAAPYVAKALGFFAKHCVDATIIQFDGGAAGTSVTAVAQGTAISNLPDVAIARGLKGKQIWALAPRPPQGYVVPAEVKTAADLKGKRLSA